MTDRKRSRARKESRQSGAFPTVLVVILVFGVFGYLLWQNAQPGAPLRAIIPTQVQPTAEVNPWQEVLRDGFGDGSTPIPTIPIPSEPYVPPTLPVVTAPTTAPLSAVNITTPQEAASIARLPTLPATPGGGAPVVLNSVGTDIPATIQAVPTANLTWVPPALPVPLNRDPQGRDHYFFVRPVDSNANNFAARYYLYGTDGQLENNPLRVHHGIDIPNPIGQTIRAGLSGTVIFASTPEQPYFQETFSYGNVVVIEHDYGWQYGGQSYRLFSLYAHLQEAIVRSGQRVETGQAIGINGNTGQVTGPHVHFEVRLMADAEGVPLYGDTVNPLLWMAPYVGHGTVAGRLVDERGDFLDDYDVTLRNVATTLLQAAATTYIFDDTVNQVNSDRSWGENFVFGDVPVGRYEVVATYNGARLTALVTVSEGMTSFVELSPLGQNVVQVPTAALSLPNTPAPTLPATPPGS